MGVKAPEKKIVIKYDVKSCLNMLVNIGYTLPTLSSMMIQAIDADSYHDVVGFYTRIARTNRNDVVKSKSNLYSDLLLFESFVLISIFCTNNYMLRTMT